MIKPFTRILISLDALLDTRSGVLFNLDPEAAMVTIKSKTYASRVLDYFPLVDMVAFREKYNKRDKNVLKYSSVTNTISLVQDFLQRAMNMSINSPFETDVEIHLNISPYVLSDYEKSLLVASLSAKLPLEPNVKIVNLSLEELNPYFIKTNYHTLIMYDFFDWLEIHSANELLKKYPLPGITIFAPAIIKHVDKDIPKDLAVEFTNAMMAMQPIVGVIFLPVDIFCSYLANDPAVYKKSEEEEKGSKEKDSEEEV